MEGKNKIDQARLVGEEIAKRALDKGIKKVVMDRAGYYYTGRIKSMAEGARKGGLEF
jgi:large subunit ribosomal protein L18